MSFVTSVEVNWLCFLNPSGALAALPKHGLWPRPDFAAADSRSEGLQGTAPRLLGS